MVKGGGAIYKTAKGMHAADQALDVYLNAKTFSNLEKAELGIYGLVSVNGFNEYILGKDMFGNELTELQRQQSLYYSILGPALMATPFIPSLVKNGKVVSKETIGKLHQLTLKTKTGAIYFGRELQGGMNVLLQNPRTNLAFSSIGISPINVMNPMRILKDIDPGMSKFSFGDIRSSAKSAGSTNKYTQVDNVAVKQTFTDEEIESIKKYIQSNPESNIKDYLKNTPPQYTSSFDDIRRVLGGQSELAGDMHQAGHLNKATLDFLLEDVMTVVSKDSSLSERAMAGFFLINKPGKVVDKVYDGIGKKIDGVGDGTKGTSKVATTDSRPDFVGKLKGEEVKLPNVKIEKVTFNKRTPNDKAQLRKNFNMIRKDLMKSMAYNPEKIKELKKAGISDNDIEDMMEYGLVPDGWQVHHKIPLDQGGTNDVENLVLIKNHPYHKVITNEQNSLTKGMKPGDSKIVDFPIPEGDIYPPKKNK